MYPTRPGMLTYMLLIRSLRLSWLPPWNLARTSMMWNHCGRAPLAPRGRVDGNVDGNVDATQMVTTGDEFDALSNTLSIIGLNSIGQCQQRHGSW